MSHTTVPALTTAQMREVDRLMIGEYGISLIQMMENAGRGLAELTRQRLGGRVEGRRIAVLCGAGNNGGGGLVAARHLSNWGASVAVTLTRPASTLGEVPAHQWRALARLPLARLEYDEGAPPDLSAMDAVLDALIGYGLEGDPRGPAAALIERANASPAPVIALDTPSGLDTTTGVPGRPCVRADATLTLALPKVGLLTDLAAAVVGRLYVGDISVPPALYAQMGLAVPNLFAAATVVPASG